MSRREVAAGIVAASARGEIVPTRDGYDLWAEVYDSDGNPLLPLEEPEVERLLGDVTGKRVLDLGCGTGCHALRLAQRGAEVTAVDFSHGMMQQARAKAGAHEITWLTHDLTERLPFDDGTFDGLLCALVLDHIADCTALYREMARVCAADGSIVLSIMHPALTLRGVIAGFRDPASGAKTHPQSASNQMADYVMAASHAGLRVDHMSEHAVDEALIGAFPRAKKYLDWPMLVMFRLTR